MPSTLPNLKRLRMLVELRERHTLAAVANVFSCSASAVSQQMALLEEEVGIPLLEKKGRSLHLTEQASILCDTAQAVFLTLEEGMAQIDSSLHTTGGTLKVSSLQTVTQTLLPPTLARLKEQYPRLRVEIIQQEPSASTSALLHEEADIAITETYPSQPRDRTKDISRSILFSDNLHLAVGHTGVKDLNQLCDLLQNSSEKALPAEALELFERIPWVMEPEHSPAREWSMMVCHQIGFEPDVQFESEDLMTHIQLVREGLALCFLPDLLWKVHPINVKLLNVPFPMYRYLVLNTRAGAMNSSGVSLFRDALLQVFSNN